MAGSTPPVIIEEVQPVETISIYCSCVKTVRQEGVSIPLGTNASDFQPNAPPTVGALILFNYSTVYHVALIISLGKNGMWVIEGNKTPCERDERWVSYNDPFIRGFWQS